MEPTSAVTIITGVLVLLFAVSEFLSIFPAIKANGIFQAIFNILKVLKEAFVPKDKK